MKKPVFFITLCLLLAFTGCNTQEEFNGLSLPFSASDIEIIELIHHTGDPLNAQQKWINDSEDVNYIHKMLSTDVLLGSGSVDTSAQTDTLYITFHGHDGTGYTIKFERFGVKKGIISTKDSPKFTYFTKADVCWIWGQLAKNYEALAISIEDSTYATEKPVTIEYDS